VDDIRIRRLGSAGHFIRMEEEMIPKIFLMEKSTSLVGKPRTRWADVVQRDAL
jgi:hypothetical protein